MPSCLPQDSGPSTTRCSARPGFTLVEVLVVIGAMAILIAMLMPTISSARASSRAISCSANLRQLITTSINYAQRNDGHLPPAHFDFATSNLHRWHGTRAAPGEPFDFEGSPLMPYLRTPQIKQCPDFEPMDQGFERSAGGYGYNNHYMGSSTGEMGFTLRAINMPAKSGMIQNPSQKIAFADAAIGVGGASGTAIIEYSFLEPPVTPYGTTSPSIHFRHRNRSANVAWADGHVTRQTLEWSYPVNIYGADNAACSLGFFGPRDNSLFQRR